MEQKYLYRLMLLLGIFFSITGCQPDRNFYPDQYNPGLSRFTARGYGIVSAYINDTPYVNPYFGGFFSPVTSGNAPVSFYINHTTSTFDTLEIYWQVQPNIYDTSTSFSSYIMYTNIDIFLPIPKSFSEDNLLSWRSKRFPVDDPTETVSISTGGASGPGSIYFVRLDPESGGLVPQPYVFSGLFQGTTGDSIDITKGRFDFVITPSTLNY